MADKTVRLQVDCQAMSPEDMTVVFSLNGSLGYFFFQSEFFDKVDNIKLPPLKLEKDEKSQASRIRAALYCHWEKYRKEKEDFELFYRRQTDKWIEEIKETLN